jgi:hypothetical protein
MIFVVEEFSNFWHKLLILPNFILRNFIYTRVRKYYNRQTNVDILLHYTILLLLVPKRMAVPTLLFVAVFTASLPQRMLLKTTTA